MGICEMTKDSEEFKDYQPLVNWMQRISQNEKEVEDRINEMHTELKKSSKTYPKE